VLALLREIPRRVRFCPCLFRARLASAGAVHPPSVAGTQFSPSPLALSGCSSTLVLRICVWRLPPTLVGASRSPLPGPPKVRAEISSSAGSFQLSTLNLRPLVPNFSSRFPPACAVNLLPCAVHPPFLLSLHIPQSIQTFGLTNFT